MGTFYIFLFILTINFTYSYSYVPLDKKDLYSILEYNIIRNKPSNIFILNQPYTVHELKKIINTKKVEDYFYVGNKFFKQSNDDNINIDFQLGLGAIESESYSSYYPILSNSVSLKINNFFLLSDLYINEKYKLDEDFHGNRNLWPTGFVENSYLTFTNNSSEFFIGRQSRNWGILNEYSLLFSDNAYPFDHIGFSIKNTTFKFSFYTAKLNGALSQDISGRTIPIGEHIYSNRFWAVHRLDYIFSDRIQFSVSEGVTYGGPNTDFEFTYLNPVYFYLVGQKNERLEANNFVQLSGVLNNNSKFSYSFDILIDDFIVNNEASNERQIAPDRLGLIIKTSYASLNESLHSLRYVRVWDGTYNSYRTYENYYSYNKYIGFPNNGYEGIKYSMYYFKKLPFYLSIAFDVYREEAKEIASPFNDEDLVFLSEKSLSYTSLSSNIIYKVKNKTIELVINTDNLFLSRPVSSKIELSYIHVFN